MRSDVQDVEHVWKNAHRVRFLLRMEKCLSEAGRCTGCETCIDICVNNAREICGKTYGIQELQKKLRNYIIIRFTSVDRKRMNEERWQENEVKFCIAFLKQLRRSAVLNFLFSVKYIHKNCKLAYRSDSAVFAHNTENRKLRTAMNSCRGFPNCNTETHFCWFPAISFPTPSPFEYPADEPFKIHHHPALPTKQTIPHPKAKRPTSPTSRSEPQTGRNH